MQASTLLFKMDRFELEIGKAAQRARRFLGLLRHPRPSDNAGTGAATGGSASRTAVGGGASGDSKGGVAVVVSIKDVKVRGRGAPSNVPKATPATSTSAGGDAPDGQQTLGARGASSCDRALERALSALVSGADALAFRRQDALSRADGGGRGRNARDGRRGRDRGKRKRAEGGREADTDSDPDSDAGRDTDADADSGSSARAEKGMAAGRRRRGSLPEEVDGAGAVKRWGRSRGSRIRSRNPVIDGWLEEGGAEESHGADAFVDLEDFIVN